MGLFPFLPSRRSGFMGKKKTCQDGCVQVHDRDVPQEAERRDALPAEDPVPALQAAHQGPPRPEVHPSRQGQEAGIQEQARLRDLPYCHAPWWTQEACCQGMPIRQAKDLWCRQRTEAREEPPIHCRGACRPETQGSPCAELLLGGSGFHLQVLRGDHDRSPPQGYHPGPQDQLDVRRRPEAQGTPWSYGCRKILQRTWEGSQVHPDQGWVPSRLLAEAQQLEAPQETLTEQGGRGGRGGVTGCDLWTTAGKSRPPPSVNNKRGSRLVDGKRFDKNTISQILLLHAAFKLCPEYILTWCSLKSVISSDFLCPLPTT